MSRPHCMTGMVEANPTPEANVTPSPILVTEAVILENPTVAAAATEASPELKSSKQSHCCRWWCCLATVLIAVLAASFAGALFVFGGSGWNSKAFLAPGTSDVVSTTRISTPPPAPVAPAIAPAPAPVPMPLLSGVPPLAEAVTEQQTVLEAARAVHELLSNSAVPADLLGGIVRLGFHDAGSFDAVASNGGADGCVDLSAAENGGLAPITDELEPIVTAAAGNLSRADVWVLAANVAIEFAGGPQLDFQVGRLDAASCSGFASRLPSAEQGSLHIQDVFVERLGFTYRDVTALMGAHVLGRAERTNSGYDGAWVPQNDRFTNAYFEDLLSVRWDRRAQPNFQGNTRTQWNGRANTMMLNTDIELAFDRGNGCTRAGGNGGACPRASHDFSSAVSEFAGQQGQQAFFQAFAPAWKKLAALGSGDALRCAFDDCSTPGPFSAAGSEGAETPGRQNGIGGPGMGQGPGNGRPGAPQR